MNSYGKAAIKAIQLTTSGFVDSPLYAWEKATSEIFGKGRSSQKKGCPRSTFLGLCEDGLVKGIPTGQYSKSKGSKNKNYALNAVKILKQYPELSNDKNSLWIKVLKGKLITHNNQMDVVIALWNEGLIIPDG